MADEFLTLANLIKLNDKNLADFEGSDLFDAAPLMGTIAAIPSSNNTQHKYLKETAAPVVGFRAVNTGLDNSVGTHELVTVDLKILDFGFRVDIAEAKGYKGGPEALLAFMLKGHLKAALFAAEKQFLNGTNSNADGFTGFAQALPLSSPMVYNATGAAADTGSSVYLIRANGDETDVMAIGGSSDEAGPDAGALLDVEEAYITTDEDANGKKFDVYRQPGLGWLGVQVGSLTSLGRICNITEETGKTLTDDMIYEAISLFPAAKKPTHVVMNRRSLKQLRKSRTATNATGAPAPLPTALEDGTPIIVTDAIADDEAILT